MTKRRLSRKRKKHLKTFIFSDRHDTLGWSKTEWLSEWDLHLMWYCGGSFTLYWESREDDIWSEVANLA